MKKIIFFVCLYFFFLQGNAQYYYCDFSIITMGNNAYYSHNIDGNHFQQISASQINWGDGNIANGIGLNGAHYYCANGTYTITIEIWVGGVSNCNYTQTVTVSNAYTANSVITRMQNNNTVDFTCYTNFGGIISNSDHTWYFGDGNSSWGSNMISHTYTTNGTYYPYVVHTFNDLNTGCPFSTTSPPDTIIITNIPVPPDPCVIHADYSTNSNGLEVNFTNLTTCSNCVNITYEWMFGDGGALSNLMNPSHIYIAPGNYFVCVTAMGIDSNQNSCSDTKCDYITVVTPNKVSNIENDTIAIYPNPASVKIYIKAASRQEKELYNSFGQLMLTTKENEIDVRNFARGIYYIKVGNAVKKIAIE